jgi:flavin reductase (DIM6/NTAB) family NADH-FMN oxidoreductase RutF
MFPFKKTCQKGLIDHPFYVFYKPVVLRKKTKRKNFVRLLTTLFSHFGANMFFTPGNHPAPLSHDPFNAIVVPRPIGWISTLSKNGVPNLAPYSFFNAVAYDPPQVMFAATSGHKHGGQKDSVQNAQDTGEFVVNVVTYALREHMNASAVAAPSDINEFEYANLTQEPSELLKAPRVAESPIHLECKYTQTVQLPTDDPAHPNTVIFGQVIGIHIRDTVIKNGKLDLASIQPVGRLGYLDYAHITKSFHMDRPTWP